MLKSYYLILIGLIFVSCKNEKTTAESAYFKEEIPSDFLSFYDKFHSDSLYQLDHIIFPLQMQSDSTPWEKENWAIHNSFDSQGGEFTRNYFHLNGLVIENISDSKGYYKIERRFSKSNDSYNLIYYKNTNAFENSEFTKIDE